MISIQKNQAEYLLSSHYRYCENKFSLELDVLFYRIFSVICGEYKQSLHMIQKNIEDLNFKKLQTLKVFSIYLDNELLKDCNDLEYFEVCENIKTINSLIRKAIETTETNLIH
jgi:hypothetical protein